MKPNSTALLATLILLLLTPLAKAQFGIYGLFTANRLAGIQSSPATFPGTSYRDSVNPSGFTGGLFYDFRNAGPFRLGADVRGTLTHTTRGAETFAVGTGARSDSVLGGIRASVKTPVAALSPYIQASAGLGRSNFGINGTQLKNAFEYHGYAGLDLRLLPAITFRVAEVGYGGLESASHNYPVASISTGVVVHFSRQQ